MLRARMSGPKRRTGQQPHLRPLVPGETPIRLWAPPPEDWRRVCVSAYLPALLPFLIKLLPPTQIVCWGQLPCKPRVTEGRTGTHPQLFQGFEPQRDTEPTSARGMHPHKRTEKPGRKEHLPATRLPWQRAAPGGKWWRLARPQEGRDTASGAEAPPSAAGPARADLVSPGGRCSSVSARAREAELPRMGEAGMKVIAGAPALPCPPAGAPPAPGDPPLLPR